MEKKKGRLAKLKDGWDENARRVEEAQAAALAAQIDVATNQTAWEYRLDTAVMLHYDGDDMTKRGVEGWEVAAVSWDEHHYPKSVIYKRPIAPAQSIHPGIKSSPPAPPNQPPPPGPQ